MRSYLKLSIIGLITLVSNSAEAQRFEYREVQSAEFARQPSRFIGQTIKLSDIVIAPYAPNEEKVNSASPGNQRIDFLRHDRKFESLYTPCSLPSGYSFIYPMIGGKSSDFCYVIRDRVKKKLPQNREFKADIIMELERGSRIIKIKHLRVKRNRRVRD